LVGFVLVFGVALVTADPPASFGADTALSLDCARDTVAGAITAADPPRRRRPQTVEMFMSNSRRSE
jgi:hypothetical protein